MKKTRVAINGFGRIGRVAARIILSRENLELVAINSGAQASSHAYLLKHDSTYGTLAQTIQSQENSITIDDKVIKVFSEKDPDKIPWEEVETDIVIDATGKFVTTLDLTKHLHGSVKKVVVSAPVKDDTKTVVMGVNEQSYNAKTDHIVSNSSCTTNCLTTTLKVLIDAFGVKRGFMTTTHAATDSQNLLDNSHKKEVRLRRSSLASMIPASTGSAHDVGKLFPELNGKILCQSVRVPLQTVSLINLVCELNKKVTVEEIHSAFIKASEEKMKGILDVAREELVSKDYSGNPHSSIIDPFMTQVLEGTLINIYAWYDNEWGYTSRLIDLVEYVL